ncbi:MAG: metal-dependent transcriptional regulator [Clostridia bacterium]|nr:metal-dependent transcriptional regulator [Clostridia bacterium]
MTPNKEDYLKTIYEDGGSDSFVSNKRLCEKLGLSGASVSQMLGKLEKQGLIEYRAYHGARLTQEGLSACVELVRSHELWEVFLMRHLGYSWREAHEDAHLLEHSASERLLRRLDAFLGFPATCPHGSVIPRNDDALRGGEGLKRLSELARGESALVRRVEEDGKLLDYLENCGLQIGEKLTVTFVEDFEGAVCCRQENGELRISRKAAEQVYVEIIGEAGGNE